MSHSDSNFYKSFAFVLGALVLFTLFIAFIANTLSPAAGDDPLAMAEQQKFISPVGRSRVKAVAEAATNATVQPVPAKQAATTETESSSTPDEVKTPVAEETVATTEAAAAVEDSTAATTAEVSSPVVNASMKVKATVATNCAGCHNTGLHGAAKPADAEAWSALADKGIDTLTMSVINGKGKMPARAESSLSDEEIKQAVQLMISKATGASAKNASGIATTATVATTAAIAAPAVTKEPVQTVEIPAAVKEVVDTTCAACHISGVANAPKYGDKEAWAKRMEKGIDAVTSSAITGIGAMPPRGGSALNDEQMKIAIEYMLSK